MQRSEALEARSGTARLNERGELEPIAVDEPLTTLLFSSGHTAPGAPISPPTASRPQTTAGARREPAVSTLALFEMV